MKNLFVMGLGNSGKTAIALGLALKFKAEGYQVAYFKPVGGQGCPGSTDVDAVLMKEVLQMSAPLEVIAPCSAGYSYLSKSLHPEWAELIRNAFAELSRDVDVVVIDGATFPHALAASGMDSVSLCKQLNAVALSVLRVKNDFGLDAAIFFNRYLTNQGVELVGNVFSHVERPVLAKIEGIYQPILDQMGFKTLGIIPVQPQIAAPTVGEYYEALGGEILVGENRLDSLVEEVVIGAMTIESALTYLRRANNKAVIIGGDRADLALAALETSTSVLVLTGGLYPDVKVLARAAEKGVAVILVHYDTYTTVEKLGRVSRHIKPGNKEEINLALANIEQYCDWAQILAALQA
ncbi:MAG: DRTGG domain-containing protein [Heliobacteriaceae bacterium]|nr:DRTGG domain-containing protein [Heliobacteriaceae bacterium]MDD4587316.1 DRTGG domain-containing protein [Heliobacteriaceae bacterium]